MKILLINQEHALFGGPGGAERSVQGLAEQYVRLGHQVTFITTLRSTYTRNVEASGIHSIRNINGVETILLARKGNGISYADLLLPLVIGIKPDVIHTNVFHTAPVVWRALSKTGIPIVHTLREYKLLCHVNMFNNGGDCGLNQCLECGRASEDSRNASGLVKGVVGISKFTLDRHLSAGFFEGAKSIVIPNSFEAPHASMRERTFAAEDGRPVFGFFGRLHESKGINTLLDAISGMPPHSIRLKLAGDIQNDFVRNKISEASEFQDVEFLGFRDPKSFFNEIDVLVVPSLWHEPFGRVAIEALAYGIPVLASERGGLIDIVDHGSNGWIFNPDDIESLKQNIQRISEISLDEWKEFSEAALSSAKSYLPSRVAGMYLEFYRKTIESAPERRKKSLLDLYHRNALFERSVERSKIRRGTRATRPLKIAVVTGEFPKRSETFVLNHVTGLLDLGVDVKIVQSRNVTEHFPPEFAEYELQNRTYRLHHSDVLSERIERARDDDAKLISRALEQNARGLEGDVSFVTDHLRNARQRLRLEMAARNLDSITRDVDVIHCHFGHRALEILEIHKLTGSKVPVVCSFHGIDVSAHLKTYGDDRYNPIIGRLRKALPVSHYFANRLSALGFDAKDIQVHRVGVDLGRFCYSERVREADGTLNLVSVGRLVEKKGFAYAIQAVGKLINEYQDVKVNYTIIGSGPDLPILEALISEMGICDKVSLVGSKTHQEVAQIMSTSHALIVPSITAEGGDQEGVPTVAMEAGASGLPVIATRHSGLPEVVLHNRTGLLSDEKDPHGMMQNILHLYCNPNLGRSLGWAGRIHVEHEFNIERQNNKILNLYEGIASGEDL